MALTSPTSSYISPLSLWKLQTETSPAIATLLKELCDFLGKRYLHLITLSDSLPSSSQVTGRTQSETEHVVGSSTTVNAMQSDKVPDKHQVVLTLLRDAIYNQWWPECDPAKPQKLVVSIEEA